jgi:hypothetical protein
MRPTAARVPRLCGCFFRHRNWGLGHLKLPINGDFMVVGKAVSLQPKYL